MIDFTCSECKKEFTVDYYRTEDVVQCEHCKVWLQTDTEYNWDGSSSWVTGLIEEDN